MTRTVIQYVIQLGDPTDLCGRNPNNEMAIPNPDEREALAWPERNDVHQLQRAIASAKTAPPAPQE